MMVKGLYVRGRTDHRDSRQLRGKSRSKSRDGRIKCYICQYEDHLKRNCPKNNRKKSTGYVNKDDQPSSSGSIYDGSEVMMVMSVDALLDWIMDSGGSYHMKHRIDLFFDYLECDGGRVLLGDNKECKIRGIGKVKVQLKDVSSFVLHNVRYIPELKRNLISLGTLEKEGYTIKLQSGKIKVINGSRVVLSGTEGIIAYALWMAMQWQVSLMLVLKKKNSMRRFGIKDWDQRGGTTGVGEAGSVWQEESRFKHEAFEKFKEWKQLVENQTRRTVKKMRTNNGLEFCNQVFKQLCIESGMARHLTVIGSPQQNGLTELIEKKTPMEMWSGHPSDYGMLRTFGCVAYSHVKQGKLEPRAVKCVLLWYPEGVNRYRLYRLDNESPKIVTRRNMVFNESVMYKDTLKDSGAGTDKSVEELQVEVELHGLSSHYQLVQDREPRIRTIPLRFRDESNMTAYAFAAAEEEDTHEPLTYQEAVACEDSSKWKAAMEEEMDSLRKNKTWEFIDHIAGKKLVSCKWLFKIKEGIEGVQRPRYKARLVDSHKGQ
ncbi:retrotransposon protein, putative, ty1-copia subclass, partial [Tanacetum coccineum]